MSALPINKALYLYCTGQATITDTISDANRTAARATLISLISDRMFPGEAPQMNHPKDGEYLFFSKGSSAGEMNMEGNAGLATTRFTIGGDSTTAEGRESLSSALFDALHGFFGTVVYDGDSITMQSVECELDNDEYVLESEAGDDLIYGFMMTCTIVH